MDPGDSHRQDHPHDRQVGDGRVSEGRAERLMEPGRLESQLGEGDLARLLALRGDEDVIELGSGAGFYTDRIAAMTSGTVYGLDIQSGMHDFYRKRGLPNNVRLILGDVTRLDLPSTSVDVACSISAWHESDGMIDIAGLARALRPGGRLVIVNQRRDDTLPEGGPPVAMRSNKEEAAAYLAPDFRVIASEDLGDHMFAVVAVLT